VLPWVSSVSGSKREAIAGFSPRRSRIAARKPEKVSLLGASGKFLTIRNAIPGFPATRQNA
jgi:hypothetical protein